jgi:hypothetical protein
MNAQRRIWEHLIAVRGQFRCEDCLIVELADDLSPSDVRAAFHILQRNEDGLIYFDEPQECGRCLESLGVLYLAT